MTKTPFLQDASLDLFPDTNFKLSNLERVHLSGPFGNALIKYLLRGAEAIKSLALGIEWLDPAFCSTQPDGRSDYLGKEYLVGLSVADLRLETLELSLL